MEVRYDVYLEDENENENEDDFDAPRKRLELIFSHITEEEKEIKRQSEVRKAAERRRGFGRVRSRDKRSTVEHSRRGDARRREACYRDACVGTRYRGRSRYSRGRKLYFSR